MKYILKKILGFIILYTTLMFYMCYLMPYLYFKCMEINSIIALISLLLIAAFPLCIVLSYNKYCIRNNFFKIINTVFSFFIMYFLLINIPQDDLEEWLIVSFYILLVIIVDLVSSIYYMAEFVKEKREKAGDGSLSSDEK